MNSIRTQLTLRLVVGGALLLGIAGALLHWEMRQALTSEFDVSLRATAQSLASLTEQKGDRIQMEFAGENMPQYERAHGSEVFLLRTAQGREIERSHSLGTTTLPLRAGSPEAPDLFNLSLPDGRALRCASLRFTPQLEDDDDDRKHAPNTDAVLVVGRDRAPLDHTLATLRAGLGFVGAGALGVLALIVHWGVRGGLVPLDRLGESVAAVGAESLATRFPVEPLPVELRPIAARLNELLARLEAAFARERRFTSTAAHELRTPLAELRALAEVNLTTPATEAEHTESWRDALASTRRMESLALRLLELARVEDAMGVVRSEPVVLIQALSAAWQPWTDRAAERAVTLEPSLPPDLVVQTDSALLGIILSNLCGNAAEHAPIGASLRVGSAMENGIVTLLFQNRAGDLVESDLPHLFERFWRKDAARADAQHHGLGLTLAVECAALLGGTLTARLLDGDLVFALRLPAAGRGEIGTPSSSR
ncbi:ATP-binding protein [Verrucomicrobiota bacterium sgz303538]